MSWISGVLGAASGIGSLFQRDKTNEMPEGAQPFLDSLGQSSEVGDRFGKKFLKKSHKAFDLPMQLWKKILTGDRASMMSTLAPEVENISTGYDNVKRNVGEFGPRGGGSNSTLMNLDQKETGDISRLFQTARTGAAQNLAGLGGQMGGIGLGSLGLGVNADQAGLGAIFQNRNLGLQQRGQDRDYYGGIGRGIGGLFGQLFNNNN
jgi:hypothetical protein